MIVLNHQVQNLFFFFFFCQVMFQFLIQTACHVTRSSYSLRTRCYIKHSCSSLHASLHTTNQIYFGFHNWGKSICYLQPVLKSREIPTTAGLGVLGWARWVILKKNSPLCCAADHSYQPPYIKGAINRRTGWYPRNGHRHHLLTKCQGKKQRGTKSANLICVMLDLV